VSTGVRAVISGEPPEEQPSVIELVERRIELDEMISQSWAQ
jgi:hypothetical protein